MKCLQGAERERSRVNSAERRGEEQLKVIHLRNMKTSACAEILNMSISERCSDALMEMNSQPAAQGENAAITSNSEGLEVAEHLTQSRAQIENT